MSLCPETDWLLYPRFVLEWMSLMLFGVSFASPVPSVRANTETDLSGSRSCSLGEDSSTTRGENTDGTIWNYMGDGGNLTLWHFPFTCLLDNVGECTQDSWCLLWKGWRRKENHHQVILAPEGLRLHRLGLFCLQNTSMGKVRVEPAKLQRAKCDTKGPHRPLHCEDEDIKKTSRWPNQRKTKDMTLHPNRPLDWAAVCHRMLQMLKIYLASKITKQIHGRKIYWRLLNSRIPLTQGVRVIKKCQRKYSGVVSLDLKPFQGWNSMRRSAGARWGISTFENIEAHNADLQHQLWNVCYPPALIYPKISLLLLCKASPGGMWSGGGHVAPSRWGQEIAASGTRAGRSQEIGWRQGNRTVQHLDKAPAASSRAEKQPECHEIRRGQKKNSPWPGSENFQISLFIPVMQENKTKMEDFQSS